ncbi:MAG: DUF433 domain-containing protein [Acidobacteria bacterium]|nr:DUF433 domain-containing protein [Acidobacteriota bacterium]
MESVSEQLYVTNDQSILGGEPIITGTRTPVRAIVELYRMGISPEEIPTHLPHLKLAEVFSALCYYSDHMEEINEYIRANKIEVDSALALDE